jgi:hypothetical protein
MDGKLVSGSSLYGTCAFAFLVPIPVAGAYEIEVGRYGN